MKVILKSDIPKLGKVGDIVDVKDGYAMNYLIPKQLAMKADTGSVKAINHQKMMVEHLKKKLIKTTTDIKQRIENLELVIEKPMGDQEKLFGAVTAQDISEALENNGL
jgi:ribosomal protein L9